MKFLLVDGNSVLSRAFYGIKLLSNRNGQYTNGVYGFLNIFLKLLKDIEPDKVAIAFDVKAPTFRVKQYEAYKAHRKETPHELRSQLPIIKDILKHMGYAVVEKPGFEADDIIGTISNLCADKNIECTIATGDKDSLQLICDNVTVRIMSTKFGSPVTEIYNTETILQKYGVTPEQLIDVKALMGDTSDNIPGVAGIGEKTALSLISKYHSIENIYSNLDSIQEKSSIKKKLDTCREIAFLSKDLATICRCVPIDLNLDLYSISEIDKENLVSILLDLELLSILKRLSLDSYNNSKDLSDELFDVNMGQLTFQNMISNREVIEELIVQPQAANIKTELTKENSNPNIEKNLYLLIKEDSYLAMVAYKDEKFFYSGSDKVELYIMLLNLSKEINLKLYTHDGKYFHHEMLRVSGESIDIEFDTLLAGYLLNPEAKNYDLQKLIALYCNVNIDYENMDSRKRIEIFSELCNIMNCLIKESNQESLLRQIEIPFSLVLADMEDQGFELDQAGLIKFGGNLQLLIEVLKNEICFMAGCEFNINSSQQMAKILFDNLGLPCGKKTKTGYSTNVEVLEFLKEKHPIITKILEYRQFTKLNSTYVDGMLKEVRSDNRIHSIFNQTETRTGRISSEKPNMQNIPIRTELGSELRKFFKASPGHELIDADYSQIELRVLAHMSGDEKMINVFKSDKDIHTKTASEVFNVDICDVTQKMRSFSKAVNFGIIYGISGFSLSKDIGVSVAQATEYINNYFSKFKGVKKYLDQLINDAVNNGYVTTLFGRKRIIPELKSNNKNIRLSGERIARNTPIQGTAADIIKIAMIKVYNRLKSEGLKSRIILQVHDELIIEAPVEEIQRAKEILYTEMERAADLAVPLKVDIGVGENWFLSHR